LHYFVDRYETHPHENQNIFLIRRQAPCCTSLDATIETSAHTMHRMPDIQKKDRFFIFPATGEHRFSSKPLRTANTVSHDKRRRTGERAGRNIGRAQRVREVLRT